MRTEDVARVDLGTFVRPPEETGSGSARVEPVHGYLVRTKGGLLLMDTGLGEADQETDDWYRPRRTALEQALQPLGVTLEDIAIVVNCHLHFDHIGGNPKLAGRPIHCQRRELETARAGDYTVPGLVDFPGARYELLDGEAQITDGVWVLPTPGHVDGHQSLVVECQDGTVILAGQAHDSASAWSADVLAARAPELGHQPPLPTPSPWMQRILDLDPRRVLFAHDQSVWVP